MEKNYWIEEALKTTAINFSKFVEENYKLVTSEELNKSALVNRKENDIYTFGSDYHFTKLVNEHGKTYEQVYELFLEKESARAVKEYKEGKFGIKQFGTLARKPKTK